MRVSVVFDNFGPYHLARVGGASKLFDVVGIELRAKSATYEWARDDNRNFPIHTLPTPKVWKTAPRNGLLPHLEEALAESAPDVVAVNGWGDFMAPQSIRWCVSRKIPIVLLSESSALDGSSSVLKTAVKRRIVGLAASALVGGVPHRDHIVRLGLHADRVFTGYNAVDNEYFATEALKHRSPETPGLRPFFLASNRFIERKNLSRLIEAYSSYIQKSKFNNHQSSIWPLCLLGDGEQKPSLITKCNELGLQVIESAPWESSLTPDSCPLPPESSSSHSHLAPMGTSGPARRSSPTVFFPGFRQIEELPRFYAHAGCFIHPALTEPWGLVVNEAMACGLPVLVSNRVGCSQDMVQDGVNGFTFDPVDVGRICDLMCTVAANDFPREAYGAASRRIVDKFSPDAFAAGLEAAARKAVEVGPARPSFFDRLLLEVLCRVR